MQFIETHAHLDHYRLNGKRDELLKELPAYGIQRVKDALGEQIHHVIFQSLRR